MIHSGIRLMHAVSTLLVLVVLLPAHRDAENADLQAASAVLAAIGDATDDVMKTFAIQAKGAMDKVRPDGSCSVHN